MISLGIFVALLASVSNAYAIVFQAAEDRLTPEAEGASFALIARLVRRPRWLAGTALLVAAWPLQILALAFAPITVVQPVLAATQLVLLVIARMRLHERVGPLEGAGALAIVGGVAAVVAAAPRHTTSEPEALRLAIPLLVVGLAALAAFLIGRRQRRRLTLVVGAGLAYAWVDFTNKLVANDFATGRLLGALLWLTATIGFGALAFLEENTALQQRPAVTVAPVIGAIQDPLPVLMALWSGVEAWGAGDSHLLPLAIGLSAVTVGGVLLGRSRAVARISEGVSQLRAGGDEEPRLPHW